MRDTSVDHADTRGRGRVASCMECEKGHVRSREEPRRRGRGRARLVFVAVLALAAGLAYVWSTRSARVETSAPEGSTRRERTPTATEPADVVAPPKGEPSDSVRTTVVAADESGFPCTLLVRVFADDGSPLPGAAVTLRALPDPDPATTRTCDEFGELRIALSGPDCDVRYVTARRAGFATGHWIRPSLKRVDREWTFACTLRRAARLRAVVQDAAGVACRRHAVTLSYLRDVDEPADSRAAGHEGVLTTRFLITDDRGVLDADDLAPGEWLVDAPQWRNFESLDASVIRVDVGENPPTTLTPNPMPLDGYASGTIELAAETSISEFGTVAGWYLVNSAGSQMGWIHDDGAFFVVGAADERVELGVVDRDRQARTRAFAVRIGRHDHSIRLEWE